MIKNTLKPCCENCGEIYVESDTTMISNCASGKQVEVCIYCIHQKVCEKYLNKKNG